MTTDLTAIRARIAEIRKWETRGAKSRDFIERELAEQTLVLVAIAEAALDELGELPCRCHGSVPRPCPRHDLETALEGLVTK